jgi:hypothetical protein
MIYVNFIINIWLINFKYVNQFHIQLHIKNKKKGSYQMDSFLSL